MTATHWQFFADTETFDIRSYGASTATADNTAQVQAAIDAAYAAGGGEVFNPFWGLTVGQLRMKSHVTLTGGKLVLKANTNVPMVVNDAVGSEFIAVRDIWLDGNKENQSGSAAHGIHFDHTGGDVPGTFTFADPHHLIENVVIDDCRGHGVMLGEKASECRFSTVHAANCDLNGFHVDWADNFFANCTADSCGLAGFHLTADAGNNRLTGCKAFYCGTAMAAATDRGEGFYIAGARNQLSVCEAQDNYGHGFTFDTASDNVLAAVVADSNGQFAGLTSAGVYLINSSGNKIKGWSGNSRSLTRQDYGTFLDFTTGTNDHNDIELQVALNATNAINVWSVSTSGTNNQVTLGASNGGMQRLGTGATPDITKGSVCYYVLTGPMTVPHVTNRWPGMRVTFLFEQDGTGGRVVSWNAAYKLGTWTPDTTASKANTIEFIFDGAEYKQVGGVTGVAA